MVDLSASSIFGVVLAIFLGEGLVVLYARQMPQGTPREVAAYALVAAAGVVYLLVQAINVFDPTGVGVIACLGARQAGIRSWTLRARSACRCPTPRRARPGRRRRELAAGFASRAAYRPL